MRELREHRRSSQPEIRALANRAAELAVEGVGRPAQVLNRQRLIETEFGAQSGNRLRIGVLTEHDLDRVARRQVQHEKNANAQDQNDRHSAEEAAANEPEHEMLSVLHLRTSRWT